jgi:hypothetical protein
MANEKTTTISLEASDVSGQRIVRRDDVPPEMTVGELVRNFVAAMRLPDNVPYQLRLDREARHVNYSERVAEAFESGDRVTLQPSIDAG